MEYLFHFLNNHAVSGPAPAGTGSSIREVHLRERALQHPVSDWVSRLGVWVREVHLREHALQQGGGFALQEVEGGGTGDQSRRTRYVQPARIL